MGFRPPPIPSGVVRSAVQAISALALGAATTLAIAWGAAARGVPIRGDPTKGPVAVLDAESKRAIRFSRSDHSFAASTIYLSVQPCRVEGERVRFSSIGLGARDSFAALARDFPSACHPPDDAANDRTEYQFGWPMRAMWAFADYQSAGCSFNVIGPSHVLRLRTDSNRDAELIFVMMPFCRERIKNISVPTAVLPVGFALDSAALAVPWFGLFSLPALRRAMRQRRGLCNSCGYDRHGLAAETVCPECGRAASRSAERTTDAASPVAPHSGHTDAEASPARS